MRLAVIHHSCGGLASRTQSDLAACTRPTVYGSTTAGAGLAEYRNRSYKSRSSDAAAVHRSCPLADMHLDMRFTDQRVDTSGPVIDTACPSQIAHLLILTAGLPFLLSHPHAATWETTEWMAGLSPASTLAHRLAVIHHTCSLKELRAVRWPQGQKCGGYACTRPAVHGPALPKPLLILGGQQLHKPKIQRHTLTADCTV